MATLIETGARSEVTASKSIDKLPNEAPIVKVFVTTNKSELSGNLSESPSEHTVELEESDLQDDSLTGEAQNLIDIQNTDHSELLIATELAKLLGVTDHSITNAADKQNKYFREWF